MEFVDDQDMIDDPPWDIVEGLADMEIVGDGGGGGGGVGLGGGGVGEGGGGAIPPYSYAPMS